MQNTSYRYRLDPSPRKFLCPRCQKKRFVRYVDIETGGYVEDPNLGRCDSESSCSYFQPVPLGTAAKLIEFKRIREISPKAFALTDKWNGKDIVPKSQVLQLGEGWAWVSQWLIENSKLEAVSDEVKYFNDGSDLVNTTIEIFEPEIKETSYHEPEILNAPNIECNLSRWLRSRFTAQKVEAAKKRYHLNGINSPWEFSTLFPQVDNYGKIRGAKILSYDPKTGKRIKMPRVRISWLHAVKKLSDFNLKQCLYGLDLVNDNTEVIQIVESEKTAIYMSILEPNKTWLACGAKSGIKEGLLHPVKDYPIVLHPDKGCFDEWVQKTKTLNQDGYNISVSHFLETTNLANGMDLTDYYELNK